MKKYKLIGDEWPEPLRGREIIYNDGDEECYEFIEGKVVLGNWSAEFVKHNPQWFAPVEEIKPTVLQELQNSAEKYETLKKMNVGAREAYYEGMWRATTDAIRLIELSNSNKP